MNEIHTDFHTTWILIVILAFLIGWDLYARKYPGGTVSEVLLNGARRWPILAVLFGVVIGHLFWFQVIIKCAQGCQ